MHFFKLTLITLLWFISMPCVFANDFETRRNQFIQAAQGNNNLDGVVLQAYNQSPINEAVLFESLEGMLDVETIDFRITRLIRILFLTDGDYEDEILSALEPIPFWPPDPDNVRSYTSENHIIMWMSANWLLHESFDWEARPTLRQNIVHYLNLKIDYGFYEFFSPVYLNYTAAALINLADFSQDEEIKTKATIAAKRLWSEILMMTNDKGSFYPTAGRVSSYSQLAGSGRYRSSIYLFTGLGDFPHSTGVGSSAIATSEVDFSDVCDSWSNELNTTLNNGHSLSSGFDLHSDLSREDRVIFQMSAGAYFHPDVADDVIWLFGFYHMLGIEIIEQLLQNMPNNIGASIAGIAGSLSRSSYIGKVDIDIYKNRGVVLSSAQDYWKGRLGWQQWPWAAAIEDQSVFTICGDRQTSEMNANTSLPYINQEENVALIMYRHNWDLPFFGINDFNVTFTLES